MTLEKITFRGYRGFASAAELSVRPLTILIGKNNAGKSAVARLPLIIATGFDRRTEDPLDIGRLPPDIRCDFVDLVYGRRPHGAIDLGLILEQGGRVTQIEASIQNIDELQMQLIGRFQATTDKMAADLRWEISEERDATRPYHATIDGDDRGVHLVSFAGLLPRQFDGLPRQHREWLESLAGAFDEVDYLGPFRERPQRYYRTPGRELPRLGAQGEGAPAQLVDDVMRGSGGLVDAVNESLANAIGPWKIDPSIQGPIYSLELVNTADRTVRVNLADTGAGVAQVVPLVVQAAQDRLTATSSRPRLHIVEQPELHLHPAAHGALAEMLATASQAHKARYLVETHSENLILRVRSLVAEERIDPSDVGLYFVHQKASESLIEEIEIDALGNVHGWPRGVFSEDLQEVRRMLSAQEARASED